MEIAERWRIMVCPEGCVFSAGGGRICAKHGHDYKLAEVIEVVPAEQLTAAVQENERLRGAIVGAIEADDFGAAAAVLFAALVSP
jgi:hypothetical protein